MGTTTGGKIADHRRPGGRLWPDFDRLELRKVLSGLTSGVAIPALTSTPSSLSPTLSVVSSSPANSAVLGSSPTNLAVKFDRSIDGFSVGGRDFDLLHLAADGSTTPLDRREAILVESLDPSGTAIDLGLSRPLTEGRYELRLDPNSQVQGLDGSSMAAGTASVIADFTIGKSVSSPITATDLGSLGPQERVAPGRLDLSANPAAVQYFQFDLAPGHRYLVGLAISAHGEGGTLDSSISLFDAQHRLIATAKEGLLSDPGDPYLFQGLQPGTYYVGVAAQQNIPDASGSYTAASSKPDASSPGGPFLLHLVADPADQPTQLLGLRLDHADPLSTSPTGLTLQFSGPLDLAAMTESGQPALTLVDQAGATWSLTPTHYDPSTGQLSLAFDQPLVPGPYTLKLAGSRSLLDLAGWAPVAPGLPAGTLGSFVVRPSLSVGGDLGPILPGVGGSGLRTTLPVESGEATTAEFVALRPGIYALEGIDPASGVRFSVLDGSGNVLATGPADAPGGETFFDLATGVYRIVLTTDSQGSQVSFTIVEKQAQNDSLLESGIGQGSALGLRLVTPQADFGRSPTSSTSSTSAVASPSPSSLAPTSPASGATSNEAGHASPVTPATPASLTFSNVAGPTLTLGLSTPSGPSVAGSSFSAGPVGRPSLESDQIGVVGPSGSSGLVAIASSSRTLPSGLFAAPAPVDPKAQAEGVGLPEPRVTLEAGLLARPPASHREDDRTLADAGWIGRLFGLAERWVDGAPTESEIRGSEPSPADLPTQGGSTGLESVEERYETATLASPLGIGAFVGLIACRVRRELRRQRVTLARPTPLPGLAGPHRRAKVRVH